MGGAWLPVRFASTAGDIAELIGAIWPPVLILVAVVLVAKKLPPDWLDRIRRVNVGGVEVEMGERHIDVREATAQLHEGLKDVQSQVSGLRLQSRDTTETVAQLSAPDIGLERASFEEGSGVFASTADSEVSPATDIDKVLWVDDHPENNAVEIATLQDRGTAVVDARSTEEALRKLRTNGGYGALISDMARRENGRDVSDAGLQLIRQVRDASLDLPIFIYASPVAVQQRRTEILNLGGNGATASPLELFELLGVHAGPGTSREVEREVRAVLEEASSEVRAISSPGSLLAVLDGKRIAVEAKPWTAQPEPAQLKRALAELKRAADQNEAEQIFLVAPVAPRLPEGLELRRPIIPTTPEAFKSHVASITQGPAGEGDGAAESDSPKAGVKSADTE